MAKKRSLNHIVSNEVFPFDVMFSFGQTNEELEKTFKGFAVNTGNYFTHQLKKGMCTQFSNGQIIVRMPNYPRTPADYGTLQHEIYHAAHYMRSHMGDTFTPESEESYAYLVGFLTKKIYEQL